MTSVPFSPALAELSEGWLHLFSEVCDMLHATSDVVKIRTTRMASAGPLPNDRDRAEFALMGREKGEAASESILALSSGFIGLGVAFATAASKHLWTTSAASVALGSSTSATQWNERHAALLEVLAQTPANPLQLASSTTRIVKEGLSPIRDRATANARRLGAL